MKKIDIVTREMGLNLYFQFNPFEMYEICENNFELLWKINFEVLGDLK